ncbi:MAG: ATP-binding protein [Thermoplasmata archaeon]
MLNEGLLEGTFRSAIMGREAEMKKLLSALDAAFRSEGSLILIEGEAGIGKSRIIAELAKHAKAKGANFYSGKCLYSEGSDPYLPFIDALRNTAEQEKGYSSQLAIFGIGKENDASRLITEGTLSDITREKTQVFETVLQYILKLAESSPIVFFLDDLHMADASSLQLFYYLGRNTQRARVLLIGAYSPEELSGEKGKNHPLVELIQRLSREKFYSSIKLSRLKPYEVTKMLSSILGSEYLENRW